MTSHFRNLSEGGSAASSSLSGSRAMPILPDPPPDEPDDEGLLTVELGLDPPGRLDKALAQAVSGSDAPSRTAIARLLAEGAVSREGAAVAPGARPVPGGRYEIALSPPLPAEARPEAIPLAIVWEDAEAIVIDKPAGMVVHPAPGAPSGTLVNALLHHCGAALMQVGGLGRPGIVHRIDKETTGLLVAAKTERAHRALSAQFAAHTTTRSYLALTHGCPDPADPRLRGVPGLTLEPGGLIRIATMLDRHPTDRQRQAVVQGRGRPAVTRFRVVEPLGTAAALVECRLETGRTHQIRVHLAHAGHGLIGDPVYGGNRRLSPRLPGAALANAFPRQALHAASLGFDHPLTGQRMEFASPLPPDMAGLLAALQG